MRGCPTSGRLSGGRLPFLRSLGHVQQIAEVLAGLEADVLRGGDRDLFLRARVAALAGLSLRHGEAAQSRNRAALALLTCVGDVVDERIEGSGGFFLGNARLLGDVTEGSGTTPAKTSASQAEARVRAAVAVLRAVRVAVAAAAVAAAGVHAGAAARAVLVHRAVAVVVPMGNS